MQTYSQTFATNTTWVMNITGKYFVTLQCAHALNVRFYKAGSKLDLGDITGLGVGLEVGPLAGLKEEHAFDRVEIDVTGPDTVKVGIGNGAARYNNSLATVNVTQIVPVSSGSFVAAQATVTSASAQIIAANAARKYAMVQNNDATGIVYLQFGAAATIAAGIKVAPGGAYEMSEVQSTQAINAIGSIATQSNVVVVTG